MLCLALLPKAFVATHSVDPKVTWDRTPGTPGAPGPYLDTHDQGSQYVLTLQQFCDEYETPASYPNVNVQILRADGRS